MAPSSAGGRWELQLAARGNYVSSIFPVCSPSWMISWMMVVPHWYVRQSSSALVLLLLLLLLPTFSKTQDWEGDQTLAISDVFTELFLPLLFLCSLEGLVKVSVCRITLPGNHHADLQWRSFPDPRPLDLYRGISVKLVPSRSQ